MITLSDDAINVLTLSRFDDEMLFLPDRQLERKLYVEVDKAIKNAGGRWNRHRKGHVFKKNAQESMQETISNGGFLDMKKELQAFYTPVALALDVVKMADVYGKRCLEPSCGEGALVKEMISRNPRHVTAIDINPLAIAALEQWADSSHCLPEPSLTTRVEDFMAASFKTFDSFWEPFDRVVMNPPFTKNQDVKHVAHAMKFLGPKGKLVAIMAANTTRSTFVKLLEEDLADVYDLDVHEVSAGAFKESGTMVNTMILEVTK